MNCHSNKYEVGAYASRIITKLPQLLILLLVLSTNVAFAGAVNWEGDVSSDWNDKNNWAGNKFPSAGDDAIIDPANYTNAPVISSNSSFNIKKVKVLNGAVLTIQADLTTTDNFEVDGGGSSIPTVNMSAGTLKTNGGKDFKVKKGGVFNLTGGTIDLSGQMEIDDGGTFNMDTTSGAASVDVGDFLMIKANSASSIFNMDAGTFSVASYVQLDGNTKYPFYALLDVSGGTFTNDGPTYFEKDDADSTLLSVSGGDVTLTGDVYDNGAGKVQIEISGGSLTFQGNLTMGSVDLFTQTGGTVTFEGGDYDWTNDGTFSATGGTVMFNDPTNTELLSTGTWSFYNVTINNGMTMSQVGPSNINVAGNWTNSGGTFNENTNTVTFNGAGAQMTSAETFYGMTINNTGSGLTLSSDVVASNTLTMTQGNIDANGNKITLGTGTGNVGTLSHTSGAIIGQFERWIASTGSDILFPVGTASNYRSGTFNFTNLTSGSLILEFVASDPGDAGLPVNENGEYTAYAFSEGFWDLTTANSLASTDFSASLVAEGFTSFDTSSITKVILRNDAVSNWTLEGTHIAFANATAGRTGLNGATAQLGIGFTSVAPSAAITDSSNISCNGFSDGSANLTVTDGTPPFSYAWSNGDTTEDLSGVTVGSYSVTVTDALSLTATTSVNLTEPAVLTTSTSKTDAGCVAGTIDLTPSGGTTPYTYAWSNSATTQDLTGLSPGGYTVTVTDDNGCTASESVTILDDGNAVILSLNNTNISCYGGSDGASDLTVIQGISPFNYNWSSGETSQDISSKVAGSYSVTVTDDNGCTAIGYATLTEPAAALSGNINGRDVDCNGNATGEADLTVNGGTTPYSYLWSNSAITQDITGLVADTFMVTITDTNSCVLSDTVIITEPTALGISSTTQDVTCAQGSVDITVSGGTTPYSYSWSNSATSEDISNLTQGTYTVTVTDDSSCTITKTDTINYVGNNLSGYIVGPSSTSSTGASDANLDLVITSGEPPYTYLWSTTATTQDIYSVTAGTYYVTTTDAFTCTTVDTITVLDGIGILYTEDFEAYDNDDTSSTKWTLDRNGNTPETFSVQGNQLEVKNSGGEVVWTSSVFSIAGYMNVEASLDLPDADHMEADDYIRVYYKIDGGTETLWESNGDNTGNFTLQSATQDRLVGNTMQIVIRIKNDAGDEDHFVDNILVTATDNLYYEPFSDYSNGTTSSTKWTTDVSGGSPSTFSVQNQIFKATNTGGEVVWSSSVTDISGFGKVDASMIISEASSLEPGDYIQVYYKLDGGAETLFPSNGDLTDDFTEVTPTLNDISGSTLQIIIRANNNNNDETYNIDNVIITVDTVPSPLSISLSKTDITCHDDNDGTIDVSYSGGRAPLTFSWSNGATTEDLDSLSGGTYVVTVMDRDSVKAIDSVTIINPDAMAATLAVTHMTDNYSPNGAIDLTVTGGRTPYSYSWSNVDADSTEDLSGIVNGEYEVDINDSLGCQISRNAFVMHYDTIESGAYIINMGVEPQTIGNGLKPYGLIYDLVRNYQIPLKWVIKPDKTSRTEIDFSHNGVDYKSGAFIIEADLRGPTVDSVITAWEALGVVGNTSVSDMVLPVFGWLTGFSNVGVDEQNENLVIPYFENAGIPSDIYYVGLPQDLDGCDDAYILPHADPTWTEHNYLLDFVTNEGGFIWTGCHAVSVIEGLYNPADPSMRMNFLSKTGLQCYGGDCGDLITESHNDPTAPYTYDSSLASYPVMQFIGDMTPATENGSEEMYIPLSTGAWNDNSKRAITSSDGAYPRKGVKLVFGRAFDDKDNGLVMYEAGHTFAGKGDEENEVAAERIFMNFILNASIENRLNAVVNVPDKMAEGETINVSVTTTQGEAPYTAQWSSNSSGFFADDTASATTFTLPYGNGRPWVRITVQVTDACGRLYFSTVPVEIFYLSATSTSDYNGYGVSCNGSSDGFINMTVGGGTDPITYNWSSGETTEDISGLSAGTYYVTITDAASYELQDTFTLTEPTAITASTSGTDILCNGNTTGAVDLTPGGGVTPYSYSWSNSATSQDISSVAAGIYTVTVTDDNSCTLSVSDTLSEPDALNISFATTDITCNGDDDGSIDITTSGGVLPYGYSWSTGGSAEDIAGLSPGTYTVTVTDDNGCTAENSDVVNEPAVLSVSLDSNDVSCYGGSDGSVDATPSGGTSPYSYYWIGTGSGSSTFSGLSAGTVGMYVTDNNSCVTDTVYTTVNQPSAALSLSISKTNQTCAGASNGTVDLTVTGGTSPYTYTWSNGATTQDLSGLTQGTYTVTVTDDNSCTASTSIFVGTNNFAASISGTDVCFNASDGTADLSVLGGKAPLSYLWTTGSTDEDLTGLSAGSYTVTVIDDVGCTTTDNVTINNLSDSLNTSISRTNVSTPGGSDGSLDLTVSGDGGPFSYSWSNGETTQDISGLTAGFYSVTITDNNGCTATDTATLTQPCLCTWAGTTNSDWTEVNNWDITKVPTQNCDVIIPSGTPNPAVVDGNAECKDLTINASASLTIPGSQQLDIYGDFTNNGTFSGGNGKVYFYGTAEQQVSGSKPISIYTLYVRNSSSTGVRLNNRSIRVSDQLNMGDGNIFTENDTVIITNTADNSIVNAGPNSHIVGKLCRYIANTGSKTYQFPVGDQGTPDRYFSATIKTHNLQGTSNITVWFDSLVNYSSIHLRMALENPPSDIYKYYDTWNIQTTKVVNGDTVTVDYKDYIANLYGLDLGSPELETKFEEALNDKYNLRKAAEEDGFVYQYMAPEGIWYFEPDQQPNGGYYDMILSIVNLSGLEDNNFGVLKRPTGRDGRYWTAGNGRMKPFGGPGRLKSDGYAMRMYLTSFSEGGAGGGDGTGLPIELVDFDAELVGDKVELTWVTATETNNDYFTVEKSNGEEFEEIAIVPGAGNSSVTRYYSEVDYDPFEGVSYYRLKQTDYDGQFTYSDMVSVNYTVELAKKNEVLVFPNPSSGEFSIVLKNPAENVELYVYDAKGNIVYQETYSAEYANFSHSFRLNNLTSGMYYLKVNTGQETFYNKKLMLQGY